MTFAEFEQRVETVFQKVLKIAEVIGPVAAIADPKDAVAIAAATNIATVADKAITDHEAAGQTPESQVKTLATLAAAAVPFITNANTAAQVKALATAFNPAINWDDPIYKP